MVSMLAKVSERAALVQEKGMRKAAHFYSKEVGPLAEKTDKRVAEMPERKKSAM